MVWLAPLWGFFKFYVLDLFCYFRLFILSCLSLCTGKSNVDTANTVMAKRGIDGKGVVVVSLTIHNTKKEFGSRDRKHVMYAEY